MYRGLKYPLVFVLVFANGLLWNSGWQFPLFVVIAVWLFEAWIREEKASRVFLSAWLAFVAVAICNHRGAIDAAKVYYHISTAGAVALYLLFNFISQLPAAAGVAVWVWCARVRRLGPVVKALGIPFVLYLGDRYVPALFPAGLLTIHSFFRLPLIQMFSLVGIEGVKYFIYLTVAFLALGLWFLRGGRPRPAWACVGGAVALAVCLVGVSHWEKGRWGESDSNLRAGIYQSNNIYDFESPEKRWFGQEERLLQDLSEKYEAFASAPKPPDFVLYSETEFLNFFDERRGIGRGLRALVKRHHLPALGGMETGDEGGIRQNAFLFIDRQGQVEGTYYKRGLFPFGEYRPWAHGWIPGGASLGGSDVYLAGSSLDASVHSFEDVRYGLSICYEDLFTQNFREQTRRGAQVMLSITSDGLFGNSFITTGHAEFARGRAIEARRPMVRVVRSGPSFVMRADGDLLLKTKMDTAAHAIVDLPYVRKPRISFYHRFYSFVPWAFLLLTAALIVLGRLARRITHG